MSAIPKTKKPKFLCQAIPFFWKGKISKIQELQKAPKENSIKQDKTTQSKAVAKEKK